jgi:hypothetical protein
LCGSPNTLATSAQSPEELPNEEQILEYAREMDSPPYQFFRSPHVDDLWMSCNGTHYPTVTLELLSTQDWAPKGKWDVHFDTGAPMCFFSYEDLLDKGIILPSQLIGKTHQSRKGYEQSYVAYTLKQQAVLECQSGDGSTISVKLNGQIVRDWIDGPYKRICEENCPYGGKGKKRLCIFRKALIGSNLVTDNHLKLVLDGVNKVTRFEKGNRRKN